MHKLYALKDKLIDELEEYADGGRVTREDAESIKALSASVDHLCNICDHAEDEMSYDDGMGGSMGNSYRGYSRDGGRGRSYRGRSYARGRGGRGGRSNYSGAEGEDIETIKRDVQKLAEKVEQM